MKSANKLLSIALSMLLIFAIAAPAAAEDAPSMDTVFAKGVIQWVNQELGKESVFVTTEVETLPEVILKISAETLLVDNQTGMPVQLETLEKGTEIAFYCSSAMTRSLTPQSAAIAILTNLGETTPAHYVKAGAVTQTEQGVRVLQEDGSIYVTVSEEIPISYYKNKMAATPQSITEGTQFLAWYDIVMETYPAQAYAQRVVIFPSVSTSGSTDIVELTDQTELPLCEFITPVVKQLEGELPPVMDAHYALPYMQKAVELGLIEQTPQDQWNQPISSEEMESILSTKVTSSQVPGLVAQLNALLTSSIEVCGQTVPGKTTVRNGVLMVPLRAVASQLGFSIQWDDRTSTASLDNGEVKTTVSLGLDSYYKASSQAIGLTAPVSYGAAPVLIDDLTYVPAELFELLSSNPDAVKVENGILKIQP